MGDLHIGLEPQRCCACAAFEPLHQVRATVARPCAGGRGTAVVRAVRSRPCVDLGAIVDGRPWRARLWAALVVAQHPWGMGLRLSEEWRGGRQQRQNAFEERDDAILLLLSHGRQTSSHICLSCWSTNRPFTIPSGRHFYFCLPLLKSV
jgi:hypothetical protein